jgi:hypothetical protein
MTWIRKAMASGWGATVADHFCPGGGFDNAPTKDRKTAIYDHEGNTIGCRGIACEQCWNQEANIDLDLKRARLYCSEPLPG